MDCVEELFQHSPFAIPLQETAVNALLTLSVKILALRRVPNTPEETIVKTTDLARAAHPIMTVMVSMDLLEWDQTKPAILKPVFALPSLVTQTIMVEDLMLAHPLHPTVKLMEVVSHVPRVLNVDHLMVLLELEPSEPPTNPSVDPMEFASHVKPILTVEVDSTVKLVEPVLTVPPIHQFIVLHLLMVVLLLASLLVIVILLDSVRTRMDKLFATLQPRDVKILASETHGVLEEVTLLPEILEVVLTANKVVCARTVEQLNPTLPAVDPLMDLTLLLLDTLEPPTNLIVDLPNNVLLHSPAS
jgi:hypothetical protein